MPKITKRTRPSKFTHEDLIRTKIPVLPILEFTLTLLLKSISRKLSRRGKLHISTFIFAIPGALVPFMRSIEGDSEHSSPVNYTKFSLGRGHSQISTATAIFEDIDTLKYHLKRGIGQDVDRFFRKLLSQVAFATTCITPLKKATLKYESRKEKLTLSFSYVITNRYGNNCV